MLKLSKCPQQKSIDQIEFGLRSGLTGVTTSTGVGVRELEAGRRSTVIWIPAYVRVSLDTIGPSAPGSTVRWSSSRCPVPRHVGRQLAHALTRYQVICMEDISIQFDERIEWHSSLQISAQHSALVTGDSLNPIRVLLTYRAADVSSSSSNLQETVRPYSPAGSAAEISDKEQMFRTGVRFKTCGLLSPDIFGTGLDRNPPWFPRNLTADRKLLKRRGRAEFGK
ncbi:unnamed protein product [Gadus morhua 'NCC']